MCEFQSLYFSDNGYVVRCKQCGHYQVAFASIMLTLTEYDFRVFHKMVKRECAETEYLVSENSKAIVLKTMSSNVHILLTKNEARQLRDILEEADTEEQALSLIGLFNP